MIIYIVSVLLVISLAALLMIYQKKIKLEKTLETERALRKKETHWLTSILDAVSSPITVTNKDMEWTFVNKAVEQFLNVKREDIIGKKCSNWGSHICNTPNCGITRLRNGYKETYFQQFGGDYHVLVSYLYNEKGDVDGHVEVVYEDTAVIAREKKNFEELAHWYESILDSVPFYISVTDTNMRWTFVNAAVENYLKEKRKDVIGRHCSHWGFGNCNTEECSILRAKRDLKQTYFSKGNLSYQVDVEILKDLTGSTMGYLALVQDITKLEKITKQQAEIEAASRAKSAFLATMSHEIRTPLNAIIGMTDIGKNAKELERKNYAFSKIEGASVHLLGIINDVLDMSKIEANKFELSSVEFDLEKMIRRVTDVISLRIDEKRQMLMVNIDRDIPRILIGDDQRLAQVITNLLGNAVKFTPENGSIAFDAHFNGEENGLYTILITVSDNGIGMNAEQQKRLFNSFQQAESNTTRKYGGTGLGLAISKSIVEMMGGKIWVKSEPGMGSTFSFTVQMRRGTDDQQELVNSYPNVNTNENQADKTQGDISGLFTGHRILLVEDVDINREIIITLFEPTKLEIDCAENGLEAVRMFSEAPDKYDLILMDVQMPEMDGYEATRRIRAIEKERRNGAVKEEHNAKDSKDGRASFTEDETRSYYKNLRKQIPIIAMTANVFREDIEKCIAAGMDSHIGKPFDFNEVLNILKSYISIQDN